MSKQSTNADKTSDTPHAFAIFGAKYELSKTVEGYVGVKAGVTTPEADVAALFGIVLNF